jgi:hypothetical protein
LENTEKIASGDPFDLLLGEASVAKATPYVAHVGEPPNGLRLWQRRARVRVFLVVVALVPAFIFDAEVEAEPDMISTHLLHEIVDVIDQPIEIGVLSRNEG